MKKASSKLFLIVAAFVTVAVFSHQAEARFHGGLSIGIGVPYGGYGYSPYPAYSAYPAYPAYAAPYYATPAPYYPPSPVVYAPPAYAYPHPVYAQPGYYGGYYR